MDARLSRGAPPVLMEPVDIAGVPATWFGAPELERKGSLLYLHGGAWCLHLPGIYRRLATALSQQTGLRVLLPEYGIDDCFAIYRWLAERGGTGRRFVLAGDSAGGNLSLVTLMRARDALLPLPDCAVLLSPATDLTVSGPSQRYNAKADPMFSPAAVDLLPDVYCPGQDRRNPRLSPLFGNWNGLPPLLFHAGSTEMLLDDSVRAYDRAIQAGVEAEIEVWVGLPHVFHVFNLMPESRAGVRAVADFIARHGERRREAVAAATVPEVVLDETVTYPAF